MFVFEWPWLSLLLPLPFIARLLLPARKKTPVDISTALRFPALQRLQEAFPLSQHKHPQTSYLFLTLLSLLWGCLTFAVMRPQFIDQVTQVQNEGYDLMLAVDISRSMQALDFSTKTRAINRLDVAKNVVGKFVLERQGDRVGLILFGEHAYLQVPLTLDTLAIEHMLNKAVIGMAGDGTAIGDAIGLAVRNLRTRPEGSRVLILLTDGVDTASSIPPLEAAKLAKQYDIRIYVIGVGKNGLVPYPTSWGRIEMVRVSLDEKLLKEISEITKGQYFRATDRQGLQSIYDKINSLEKTKANVRMYLVRKSLYRYPLGAAAVFLFLLFLLPLYRRQSYGV